MAGLGSASEFLPHARLSRVIKVCMRGTYVDQSLAADMQVRGGKVSHLRVDDVHPSNRKAGSAGGADLPDLHTQEVVGRQARGPVGVSTASYSYIARVQLTLPPQPALRFPFFSLFFTLTPPTLFSPASYYLVRLLVFPTSHSSLSLSPLLILISPPHSSILTLSILTPALNPQLTSHQPSKDPNRRPMEKKRYHDYAALITKQEKSEKKKSPVGAKEKKYKEKGPSASSLSQPYPPMPLIPPKAQLSVP